LDETVINGYTLDGPLSSKNAGFCKWGFARKDGRECFIKELINPVYPSADAPYDEETKEKIIGHCEMFEKQQVSLFKKINRISDGNLIRVLDFFRAGSRYYIVTRKINAGNVSLSDVRSLAEAQKVQICLSLSHTIMGLHAAGLVHGDIKVTNVLFERTIQGYISAIVIDVDSCFFSGKASSTQPGDPVYYSPERAKVVLGLLGPETMDCKVDVFALGLLFHEILTGGLPWFDEQYSYAFEACLDGREIKASEDIPLELRSIIDSMLTPDPKKRISMQDVFWRLKKYFLSETPIDENSSSVSDDGGDGRLEEHEKLEDKDKGKPMSSRLRFGPGIGHKPETAVPNKLPDDFTGFHRPGDLKEES